MQDIANDEIIGMLLMCKQISVSTALYPATFQTLHEK